MRRRADVSRRPLHSPYSRKSLKQPIKELSDAGVKDAAKLIESRPIANQPSSTSASTLLLAAKRRHYGSKFIPAFYKRYNGDIMVHLPKCRHYTAPDKPSSMIYHNFCLNSESSKRQFQLLIIVDPEID